MVEVKLVGDADTVFRRIRETLQRIGVESTKRDKTLIQTCHILHKQGRYYICHYKFLYCLDGGENHIGQHDIDRQSKIIRLLMDWNMVEVLKPEMIVIASRSNLGDLKVLSHGERAEWEIQTQYRMGRRYEFPGEHD
jgi:hypothetical protein